MKTIITAVCVGVALSCARVTVPEAPVEVPTAQASAEAFIEALHAHIEKGDLDVLSEMVAPEVLVWGPRTNQVHVFRDTALAALKRWRGSLVPVGRHVALGSSQTSGWFFEALAVKSAQGTLSLRVTGHVVATEEGRWRLDALHVSEAAKEADLTRPDAAVRFPRPQEWPPGLADDAGELVALTKRLMHDIQLKVETLSARPQAVLIGTGESEVYVGGQAFKDIATPQLAALKSVEFTMRFEGGVRARVADDGQTAWVAGHVIYKQGRQKPLPLFRVLWVYAKEEGHWALVQEHQSVAQAH